MRLDQFAPPSREDEHGVARLLQSVEGRSNGELNLRIVADPCHAIARASGESAQTSPPRSISKALRAAASAPAPGRKHAQLGRPPTQSRSAFRHPSIGCRLNVQLAVQFQLLCIIDPARRGRRGWTAPRRRRAYSAGTASWMRRPNFAGSASLSSRGTRKYSKPAGSTVSSSRASSPRTLRPCGTFLGSAA